MTKKPKFIEYEDGTKVELSADDAPELTASMAKKARSFKDAFPEAHEDWKRGRGRPKKDAPKKEVKLRIDAPVLASFKATGKGWQTRMNDVLSAWVKRHPV